MLPRAHCNTWVSPCWARPCSGPPCWAWPCCTREPLIGKRVATDKRNYLGVAVLGTAVLGVAVEGVAVDGVAVDGTAVVGAGVGLNANSPTLTRQYDSNDQPCAYQGWKRPGIHTKEDKWGSAWHLIDLNFGNTDAIQQLSKGCGAHCAY